MARVLKLIMYGTVNIEYNTRVVSDTIKKESNVVCNSEDMLGSAGLASLKPTEQSLIC